MPVAEGGCAAGGRGDRRAAAVVVPVRRGSATATAKRGGTEDERHERGNDDRHERDPTQADTRAHGPACESRDEQGEGAENRETLQRRAHAVNGSPSLGRAVATDCDPDRPGEDPHRKDRQVHHRDRANDHARRTPDDGDGERYLQPGRHAEEDAMGPRHSGVLSHHGEVDAGSTHEQRRDGPAQPIADEDRGGMRRSKSAPVVGTGSVSPSRGGAAVTVRIAALPPWRFLDPIYGGVPWSATSSTLS